MINTLNWCEARPSFERERSSNAPDVAKFLSGYFVSPMYSFRGCQTKPWKIFKLRSKFQGQTKCRHCTTANFEAKFSVTYAGFHFHIFAYESSLYLVIHFVSFWSIVSKCPGLFWCFLFGNSFWRFLNDFLSFSTDHQE